MKLKALVAAVAALSASAAFAAPAFIVPGGQQLDPFGGIDWASNGTVFTRSFDQAAANSGRSFTFESTLGGTSITRLLGAATATHAVRIWYVALASPEHHIDRVRERVTKGGHHIPSEKIRFRYVATRGNVVALLPRLAALRLFDNTERAAEPVG